jgi:protease-4
MRRASFWLGTAVVTALLAAPTLRAADDDGGKKASSKATVAVFNWSSSIPEMAGGESFSALLSGTKADTLRNLVSRLNKAAKDDSVKAVVFLVNGGTAGSAQVEELRQALKHVRDAGKDVEVYADQLSTREYVLVSGASRISIVPTGEVWLTGIYGEAPYLRGLLNKLSIKPDYLTCGAYKSASEIFMREGPSKEADDMQNWLLDSTFNTQVHLIARGRNVDVAKVKHLIDNGPYTAERAKEAGLIDAVEHLQDFEAGLKKRFGKHLVFDKHYGKPKTPELDFSSPFALFKILGEMANQSKKKPTKDAVAIVHVDGPIVLSREDGLSLLGGGSAAVASKLRKALDEAAEDPTIKAVVLRIDSPGGSAVASEIILDATKRVKAKKPFVVSMGDVAGSGGYYVACAADTIFADKSTITGSIGVVSGKFVTNDMWKKVGITFKAYKRGASAGMLASDAPFSEEERQKMQQYMDEIYGVFKQHVMDIRGQRLKKPLDELAGGRVWTGQQALQNGLVDKIGTLEDAIEFGAAQAKLKDYEVRVVPRPKNFLEEMLEETAGDKDEGQRLDTRVRRTAAGPSLIELAMPYLQHLDPERVRTIRLALARMQLMQQEGVVLMMPEITLGR